MTLAAEVPTCRRRLCGLQLPQVLRVQLHAGGRLWGLKLPRFVFCGVSKGSRPGPSCCLPWLIIPANSQAVRLAAGLKTPLRQAGGTASKFFSASVPSVHPSVHRHVLIQLFIASLTCMICCILPPAAVRPAHRRWGIDGRSVPQTFIFV